MSSPSQSGIGWSKPLSIEDRRFFSVLTHPGICFALPPHDSLISCSGPMSPGELYSPHKGLTSHHTAGHGSGGCTAGASQTLPCNRRLGMSMLFISDDLNVVQLTCDRFHGRCPRQTEGCRPQIPRWRLWLPDSGWLATITSRWHIIGFGMLHQEDLSCGGGDLVSTRC
jgi:hypothetical protein